jgi:hypothetical protein
MSDTQRPLVDTSDLKDALADVLREYFMDSAVGETESANSHAIHHEWIALQMAKEERRKIFWRAIATKAFPTALVFVVISAWTAGWGIIVKLFSEHWK